VQRAEAWRVEMKAASKPEHEISLSFPGPFQLSDMLRGGDLAGSRYLWKFSGFCRFRSSSL